MQESPSIAWIYGFWYTLSGSVKSSQGKSAGDGAEKSSCYCRAIMGIEMFNRLCREKSEKREQLRQRVIEDVFKALGMLHEEVSFKTAYVFGSVIIPHKFWELSDIDIAFEGLERDKLFLAVGYLSRLLQRDVNAVHIEDIHFAEKIGKEAMRWKRN
jgi:predicted nucleotidyltransferase